MERSILYPFYAFSSGITIALVIALLIGRTRLRDLGVGETSAPLAAAP
jgi:hypothetical protein